MSKNTKQPDDNICGAKTRDGSPCELKAGWGTDHVGTGKCKLHGGASNGAPKGNKNAVKHGVYEQVVKDRLNDDEKQVYDNISADNSLREELKILRFKLIRLLDPVEIEQVVGTQQGVERVRIEADEITKSKAIAHLANNIRRIVKEMNRQGQDTSSLDELVQVIAESRTELD